MDAFCLHRLAGIKCSEYGVVKHVREQHTGNDELANDRLHALYGESCALGHNDILSVATND
jgi:hypothetical protein